MLTIRVCCALLLSCAAFLISSPLMAQDAAPDEAFDSEMRRELIHIQNARIEAERTAKEKELRLAELSARRGVEVDGTPIAWPRAVIAVINSNWIRPPVSETGREGCTALIELAPNGDVMSVKVEACPSRRLKESILAAVVKSSPLPLPGNPADFRPAIRAHFVPKDEL